MLSVEIGVQRGTMCVQAIRKAVEVDVGAVSEVDHDIDSKPRRWAMRKKRL